MSAPVDTQLTDERLWLPISDAARRHSVSKQAISKRVSKLVAAGRLSTRKGPRGTVLVNIVALDRAIAEESDPAQDLRNGREPRRARVPDDADLDIYGDQDMPSPAAHSAGSTSSYHRSRAEREAYQAENARLDLSERLGRLADKEDVERRTMTAFRKVRDRLLAFPATVADKLTVATDARSIRMILADEMRHLLEQLAAELDHLGDDDDELDDA